MPTPIPSSPPHNLPLPDKDDQSINSGSSGKSSLSQISMLEGQLQYQRPSVVLPSDFLTTTAYTTVQPSDNHNSTDVEFDHDFIEIAPIPKDHIEQQQQVRQPNTEQPQEESLFVAGNLLSLPLQRCESNGRFQQYKSSIAYHGGNYFRYFIWQCTVSATILSILYLLYLVATNRVNSYFNNVLQYSKGSMTACQGGNESPDSNISQVLFIEDVLKLRQSVEPINFISAMFFTLGFLLWNGLLWSYYSQWCHSSTLRHYFRDYRRSISTSRQDIELGTTAWQQAMPSTSPNDQDPFVEKEPCYHDLVAIFSQYRCYLALRERYQALRKLSLNTRIVFKGNDDDYEVRQKIGELMEELWSLMQTYRKYIRGDSASSHRLPGYQLSRRIVVCQMPRRRLTVGWIQDGDDTNSYI